MNCYNNTQRKSAWTTLISNVEDRIWSQSKFAEQISFALFCSCQIAVVLINTLESFRGEIFIWAARTKWNGCNNPRLTNDCFSLFDDAKLATFRWKCQMSKSNLDFKDFDVFLGFPSQRFCHWWWTSQLSTAQCKIGGISSQHPFQLQHVNSSTLDYSTYSLYSLMVAIFRKLLIMSNTTCPSLSHKSHILRLLG